MTIPNNLQLIVQPYIYSCSLNPWLKVFDNPHLTIGFKRIITIINEFTGWMPVPEPQTKLFSSAWSDERGISRNKLGQFDNLLIPKCYKAVKASYR